jgi:hypothetical protein
MSCKISIKNDGNKSFLIIDECERSIGFTTQINLGKNKYIDTCIKKFEEFEDF